MSKRDIRLFISDILESCEAIFSYVKEMSFDEFTQDRKTYTV